MSFTLLNMPREKLDFLCKGNEIISNWKNFYYDSEQMNHTFIHSLFHPIKCHIYRRLYQNKEIVHHRIFRLYVNNESPNMYKIIQFDGLADDIKNPRTMATHTVTVMKTVYYRIQDSDPLVYIRDEVYKISTYNVDSLSMYDELIGSGYYAHLPSGILYLGIIQPTDSRKTIDSSIFLDYIPVQNDVIPFFLHQNISFDPHIYDNTDLIQFATKYKLNNNAAKATLERLINASVNGYHLP